MKLKIPLIFHFNQDLVEFSGLASAVCYRGLLRTLLDAPVKSNIHISGTLVQALRWIDPEPLALIRSGLANGQFELMGSTHAQNILIAGDPWDNAMQIELHREILESTFDVRPESFWNPERCWSQSLVPLLADAGYRTVTIEDHILDRSGAPERIVYETGFDGRSIRVVRDDERLKHLFNYAAWFGKPDRVHRYLENIAAETGGGEAVFAYAEDAEAMGLWGYAVDVAPDQTWDRLAMLLVEIAGRGDVETVLIKDLTKPARSLERIEDGSAAWMDASLLESGRPYHEDGFSDWFHFIDTSPKLRLARQKYAVVREALRATPLDGPLVDLARHVFLTHQYEFGCIGIGGPGTRVWNGAIAALSLLRLAAAESGQVAEDWNGDRVTEILARQGDQAVVLTPHGGRVMYWANLDSGRLIVGNPSSVVPGSFVSETAPPLPLRFPWSGLPTGFDYAQHIAAVSPPTPLGKYLPDWIWDPADGELALAMLGDRAPAETRRTLSAQQGAFLDEIVCGGEVHRLDQSFSHSGLAFHARVNDGLALSKEFTLTPVGISVNYRLAGRCETPVQLQVSSEIAGDYTENLRQGKSALDFFSEDGAAGVRTASGETIRMAVSIQGGAFSHRESFHAITVIYTRSFDLSDGGPAAFQLALTRES